MPPYEFVPNKFTYEVIVKKNMVRDSSNRYNINIGCIDDSDSLDLSSRLSKIFTNPEGRQLVPKGISINNNREFLSSFVDMPFEDADFVFIESEVNALESKLKTIGLSIQTLYDSVFPPIEEETEQAE
jgi:hypothetical protein